MRIVMISTDQQLTDRTSRAFQRQQVLFKGQELFTIVLQAKSLPTIREPGITILPSGGSNKLQALWLAYRLLKTVLAPDIVLTQDASFTGWLGHKLARRQKRPLVLQLHGDYLDNPLWIQQRWYHGLLNQYGKWLLKRAQGIRCVSGRLKKQVHEQFGIPSDRLLSLPIGSELDVFTPASQPVDEPSILFVGRLIDEKEPILFCQAAIDVLRTHPAAKIRIAGTGEREAVMRDLFAKAGYGNHVTFLGQQSGADLAATYRQSRMLVHTASWEGWGMPMIEAMACGCPIVTTDSGCAGEAVRDGEQGIVVPIRDQQGLAQGMRRLLDDQAFYLACREASIKEAQAWSLKASRDVLLRFLEQVQSRP